jgi:alkylation response protein AidB-like acyl-CoA dehydrogenase
MINYELSKDQKLLQDAVYESARSIDNTLPFRNRWKYLANTGIIGTCVNRAFGGSDLGALEMLIALEALAKGNPDNGLSFALAAHTLACVIPIHQYGTEKQKQKYLPLLISGDLIAANAMTESESGSDVFNMQTKATKKGNNYLLNGTKTFVSNNEVSDLVLTYAVTNADKGFFGGISGFLVEKEKYSVGTQFQKMGLESCSLGEINFDNAELIQEDILGEVGGGGPVFNHSMEWERICLAGIHLGAMERVLAKTINFTKHRKSQGQSISKFQGVSHPIAEMQVLLEVSKSYAYKVARMLDRKQNVSKESAITKLFVSNSIKEFMLLAMQIFGGYGYISDYGIEQEVRDALASTLYSGTSEIQKNIIVSNLGL